MIIFSNSKGIAKISSVQGSIPIERVTITNTHQMIPLFWGEFIVGDPDSHINKDSVLSEAIDMQGFVPSRDHVIALALNLIEYDTNGTLDSVLQNISESRDYYLRDWGEQEMRAEDYYVNIKV